MISFPENEFENTGSDDEFDVALAVKSPVKPLRKKRMQRALIPTDPAKYKSLKQKKKFKTEIEKVSAIMDEREKVANVTAKWIHFGNIAAGVGEAGFALSHPILGASLLVSTVAVHFINRYIKKNAHEVFTHGHWALDVCANRDVTDIDTNQVACDTLHKTERYIRYLENGRSIASTVVKFGLGRVGSALETVIGKAIEVGLAVNEGREGFAGFFKEKEIPSTGMRRGIYNIEENLNLPHPVHKPFLPEKITKHIPQTLSRIIIRPEAH